MKCKKCGASLKPGCLYCSVCGAEVLMVPEYNVFENDVLDTYIGDGELIKKTAPLTEDTARDDVSQDDVSQSHATQGGVTQDTADRKVQEKDTAKQSKAKKMIAFLLGGQKKYIFLGSFAAVLLAFFIAFFFYERFIYTREHSAKYQYELGIEAYANNQYPQAVEYLSAALNLDGENETIAFALVNAWVANDQDDLAENYLNYYISSHEENEKAYELLISIYASNGEYEKLDELSQTVTTESIKELLAEYTIAAPVFSVESGNFGDDLSVSISDSHGSYIYYTTDGTDPIENGKTYRNPILFSGEGTYELRAVCKDARGVYSKTIKAEYTIAYKTPDTPVIYPATGFYSAPQSITLEVPDDCNAYYTWDGTTPTKTNGFVYTGQIEIPIGPSVFQVVYISKNGKSSAVAQAIYQLSES